jgi:hypothetical protein
MKSIYELDLHETVEIKNSNLTIQRVPSGWNYIYKVQKWNESIDDYTEEITHIVFVPFDYSFR